MLWGHPMDAEVIKVCGCCEKAYTRAEWESLECLGHMGDSFVTLDLRNCVCGSTISIVVPPGGPIAYAENPA